MQVFARHTGTEPVKNWKTTRGRNERIRIPSPSKSSYHPPLDIAGTPSSLPEAEKSSKVDLFVITNPPKIVKSTQMTISEKLVFVVCQKAISHKPAQNRISYQ